MFEYKIGDKVYVQKKLVFGQIRQLLDLLKGIEIPAEADTMHIIDALGPKISKALAIVLTEKGKSPKDKDLDALAEEIQFNIEPETLLKVVEDFFDCNPVRSLLNELSRVMRKIEKHFNQATQLKKSFASLQEETLPEEMKSSGDTPQKKPDPTLTTG